MTPKYYKTGPDADLFDVFVYRYGLETVQAHLEMNAIEYLYRAGLKGQYTADLTKVASLVARVQTLAQSPPTPPPSLDALEQLQQEDAPSRQREPDYQTVLQHCAEMSGEPLTRLRLHLKDWGIPPDARYDHWAQELARCSDGHFPAPVPLEGCP